MSAIEPNELTDSDSPLCCHIVECTAVSCSGSAVCWWLGATFWNIDESEPKFQPALRVCATDTEIRSAKRGVYDNFRFLSSNGLVGKTKQKVVWQVGNVRHTPFRAASVTLRRHAACWGARDRTALTKPCGNERGATDRREERGIVTDGRNAATTERQPDSVRESEQTRYNSSKACVRLRVCASATRSLK